MPGRRDSAMGKKVRIWRQREGLAQVELADRLGISASYLNLIEHGRRPLTAPLLLKLAQRFDMDLSDFGPESDQKVLSDLSEVFADGLFEGHELSDGELQDFALQSPGIARAVVTLYEAYHEAQQQARTLASRMAGGQEAPTNTEPWRLPSEEVSELLQRHLNYFPTLEEAAERLWRDAGLESHDLFGGLVRHLEREHGIGLQVLPADGGKERIARQYLPERKLLLVSELLPPRSLNFQLAHQLGLLTQSEAIEELLDDRRLTTQDSRSLARVALANYFAGAVLMPYQRFYETAEAQRYDIELLGHRFRTSFEQVCHRLTSLRAPGKEGIPFHFLRVDIAGNISKRFSASGIGFARFSGACPRWNLVTCFMTPGQIRTQLSQMPDGRTYFCLARTVSRGQQGFNTPPAMHAICLGCSREQARRMVYADAVDLDNIEAAVPVGVTCRLCERMDCEQRAFPPLQRSLEIDENTRGYSFYSQVKED